MEDKILEVASSPGANLHVPRVGVCACAKSLQSISATATKKVRNERLRGIELASAHVTLIYRSIYVCLTLNVPSMYPSLCTTAITLPISFPDRSLSLTLSLTLIISYPSTYQTICLIYLSHCVTLSFYMSLHLYLYISIYIFLLIQMLVYVNSTRCESHSRRSSRRVTGGLGMGVGGCCSQSRWAA